MSGKWPVRTLREAGVMLIDCEHRTPPAAETGYPYVAIPQMKDGRLDLSDARKISPQHFAEWTRKARPMPHDVILSRRCNPGDTVVVPADTPLAVGQNLVLLRADGRNVHPPFLRWLVRGPEWWDQIRSHLNVGAVFDSLKCADIPNFRLSIPPLPEQRAIAAVLGALDDKIELNRRMCRTLEGIARAIFQSWFVDFDAVRTKAAGAKRFRGMPQAIFNALPAAFTDSLLGPIPKEWRVAPLSQVSTERRESVSPAEIDPGTPYIALEHMPRRSVALREWGTSDSVASGKLRFAQGDILFGKLRPYFHKVGVAPIDGVCSTDIVVLRPASPEWFGFVLGHVSSGEFVAHTDRSSTGTKMPRTNWRDMSRYEVVLPPAELAAAYARIVAPLVARTGVGIHVSQAVAAIRDALLPKLVSGEIRIKDAERIIPACARGRAGRGRCA